MAFVPEQLKQAAEDGYDLGAEEGIEGVMKAGGLADGAFTLLLVLITLVVAALVGGAFIDAVPADGAFNESIVDMEDNAATAFILFAVGLLIIPAAAVVGYLWTQMGGMIGGGARR